MTIETLSRSARIHDSLDHPVIDADGHNIDFMPLLDDYLREFAGAKGVEQYHRLGAWFGADDETRRAKKMVRPLWWSYPTRNTIDHITTIVPALLEERLGELGLDYTVIYPSPLRMGLPTTDSDFRQAYCRALNTYQRDLLAPHAARMTPAAIIPMHTPSEAIEELEYAINVLGMKATLMPSYVQRRLPLEEAGDTRIWWDNLALDSEYDYDPVWAKCEELKVAPAFHSGTAGHGSRTSYSNSLFNHIGHFAAGQESLAKALFFGGVTQRFPDLNFAFLESGVNWAVALLAALVDHWKKRNREAMYNCDPANLDYGMINDLFQRYGNPAMQTKLDRLHEITERLSRLDEKDYGAHFDEFAAANITSLDDLRARFVPHFFFGCEGDDPLNVLAYDRRVLPFDCQLNAIYGSDIAHFDVPNMSDVLAEAYEPVEDGLISLDEFRQFVFAAPARLFAGMNPDFFKGTAVEEAVSKEIIVPH